MISPSLNNASQINVGPLRFNPGVSGVSLIILWGFAIWCMTGEEKAQAELSLWRDWVAYWFTWFYIGSQNVWICFALYIYYQYGDRKLCAPGKEGDMPEFSNASYFMMLFTCGVAVGMFFFGVSEPMDYYTGYSGSRYFHDPGMSDSEKAQWAITLTVFHWGLHGWIPYCLVGLTLGFASYRQGKPLTMRYTLYPLLGDRINGWLGDAMDILSIVVVVAGVCTSLGLGTQQIAQGLYRLNQDLYDPADEDEQRQAWVIIIVVITGFACISVVSGLHKGIKYTATSAFVLANFVGFMVFAMDDAVYFLDIMCQTTGHYLQNVVGLGFVTDAFQRQMQHGNPGGEHNDVVNKPDYLFPGAPPDAYESPNAGGNPKFMQWWTIFYWGWWIAWSPFVGTFIARISKGRSIREVFNYSMTAPLIYVIVS
jgi:choline-glycine betaine transporter